MFQDNYLRFTASKDSYRFDQWMLRFLFEHWLALEDKLNDKVASPSQQRQQPVDEEGHNRGLSVIASPVEMRPA